MKDRCNWMLNPQVFGSLIQSWIGPCKMDLFASCLTRQLLRFFNWRPDPEAEKMDAFNQDCSIARDITIFLVLDRLLLGSDQNNRMPGSYWSPHCWTHTPWFPALLVLTEDYPHLLPVSKDLMLLWLKHGVLNEAGGPGTSCMAYTSSNHSHHKEFLQNLLSSSYSHGNKTKWNCNSLFAKWACWCQQQGRNLTAGPVKDVINLLDELYEQGYQYCSLNSSCSAISSVHSEVDSSPTPIGVSDAQRSV